MSVPSFQFRLGTTILFGAGTAEQLPARAAEFGARRIFVVTDQGVRKAGLLARIQEPLMEAGFRTTVWDEVEPDPGLETIHRAAASFQEDKYDLIIALGGGSPIDTAKGVRVIAGSGGHIRDYAGVNKVPKAAGVPLIALPTTSGTGSEVTVFAVLSDWENKVKITVTSPHLAPDLAIVDPLLTIGAPPGVTAASGVDALAHAIEAFVSQASQPPADALALRAVELAGTNLRTAVADGRDLEARTGMALGSLLAGMAFNNAFLGLTHSIGAALSGHAHVGHGVAIGLLLPYVMEYNAVARPEKFRTIAAALGRGIAGLPLDEAALEAVAAVFALTEDLGLPRRLRDLGVAASSLAGMARDAMGHGMLRMNPRPPAEEDVLEILRKAY